MNIDNIKLYHYPASRSARVKWALHETVGDNFEVEKVPLYEGKQYDNDYLQKNPNHAVPLLEFTGPDKQSWRMIESAAMVAFLADAFPEKKLAPATDQLSIERADYLQMLHFGSGWADMMLWQIRIHEHVLPKSEKDDRTITRYRHKFESEVEPQLITRLEQTPYICGESFSAADCIIAHDIMWAKAYDLCKNEVFGQYLSRVSKRPAFLQAFSDAHEFVAAVPEGKAIINKFTG